MKSIKKMLWTAAALLTLMGCSTVKVVTDVNSETDFSEFTTFKVVQFVNEEDQQANKFRINPMNRDRIKSAVERNAEARGMKRVDSDPDVVLLWATDVDIEKSYSSSTNYTGGAYWGYRGRYYMGGGPTYTTTNVNKYYMGKLTIAVVEPDEKKMLWYGQGTKDISGDAGKAEETINKVVDKIMEQFPIGDPVE